MKMEHGLVTTFFTQLKISGKKKEGGTVNNWRLNQKIFLNRLQYLSGLSRDRRPPLEELLSKEWMAVKPPNGHLLS